MFMSTTFCFCWNSFSILKVSRSISSSVTAMLSPFRSWKEPIQLQREEDGSAHSNARIGPQVSPLLRALPSEHEREQLVVRLDALSDDGSIWVLRLVQFVEGLLVVDVSDGVLGLLETFLNTFDICRVLKTTRLRPRHSPRDTRRLWCGSVVLYGGRRLTCCIISSSEQCGNSSVLHSNFFRRMVSLSLFASSSSCPFSRAFCMT